MYIGQPFSWLPKNPFRSKVSFKIALGIIFLTFFLGYQPTLAFPPKQNIAHAQTEINQTITAKEAPIIYQLPHPGYISTYYSSYHPAVDIATGLGMPIKSIAKGKVLEAGFNFWGLGLTVIIDHGYGYKSQYAHMGKIYVKKDQEVTADDFLGEVGLTGHTSGPHTHLEIKKDEIYVNPLTLLPEIRKNPQSEDFVAINPTPQASTNQVGKSPIIPQLSTSTFTNFIPVAKAIEQQVKAPEKLDFKKELRSSL